MRLESHKSKNSIKNDDGFMKKIDIFLSPTRSTSDEPRIELNVIGGALVHFCFFFSNIRYSYRPT